MPAVSDSVWSARDTTPAAIEAALRDLLKQRHAEFEGYVPARVLNLVCIVDKQWSGEIANRLRGVGRYHASRTIVRDAWYRPTPRRRLAISPLHCLSTTQTRFSTRAGT